MAFRRSKYFLEKEEKALKDAKSVFETDNIFECPNLRLDKVYDDRKEWPCSSQRWSG
jgi:hypothetical protein